MPIQTSERITGSVCQFDPLQDPRWTDFVDTHPRASVFHTRGWIEALFRTYRYRPIAFTTSPPTAELGNAVVFCHVRSRLTGQRLVSLPFSDHCEPLVGETSELEHLLRRLQADRLVRKWKYLELRPLSSIASSAAGFQPSDRYFLHVIDLRPSLESLFRSFHKDSVQRRIRKAEKEGVSCEVGRSESLLQKYYRLALQTRRRHQVPPQPLEWYRNLLACMGEAIEIYVASKGNTAVASIITLRFRNTVVYKYGCSDTAWNYLGATPLLFWRAIERAKAAGVSEFDLGRSDLDNQGLITFKARWASQSTALTYWRFPGRPRAAGGDRNSRVRKFAKLVFGYMPDSLLEVSGRLLYPHVG
jgi:CelD/BcsL family acetyltransferase involved in cellulose biosynthesis